ncbi:MAG: hypothetical protein M1827_001822 [Pycnora praestabilis]|nr:MAG: hypothetical protein M1827_001822 [Pycnora praestabilis]
MPIFHDPDSPPLPSLSSLFEAGGQDSTMRNPSEESIRTEFLDGPISDEDMEAVSPIDKVLAAINDARLETSDRGELIERIKRGESPTWVPNRTLGEYFQNHNDRLPKHTPDSPRKTTSPLLPAAELKQSSRSPTPARDETLCAPSEIERPRSALHSGDFTHIPSSKDDTRDSSFTPPSQPTYGTSASFGTSPSTPWYTPSPSLYTQQYHGSNFEPSNSSFQDHTSTRSRAPSLSSYSSSFVLKTPTSPLVWQSNSTDLDFSPGQDLVNTTATSATSHRRHTLPPHPLYSLQSSPSISMISNAGKPTAALRREGTFPYQAHQSHRSFTSNSSLQAHSMSEVPAFLRSRRPSSSSDTSPLHHAPMVGSYEESILRGRMSTTPSKPLNFMAQIGVLGRGNCKPNLRCPGHVSVAFPAVFYSYSSGSGRTTAEDGPSPYVGLIDLESSLGGSDDAKENRRRKRHITPPLDHDSPSIRNCNTSENGFASPPDVLDRRKREKKQRRSLSPRAPPGGSYRIPQQGQLQIVIKNPNKTAVKLFLVPYDLEGMEPGTKTFIRQRSYSAGPIVDIPKDSQYNSSKEHLEDAKEDPRNRPTLRYLIHLHICCSSKGRFYLYKSIRVVFANRVPDGKEKLIIESHLPEPRYSTYKPGRESNVGLGAAGANLAVDKAFRRRSSGFPLTSSGFDATDVIGQSFRPIVASSHPYEYDHSPSVPPVQPIPFGLTSLARSSSSPHKSEDMDLDSSQTSRPTTSSEIRSPISDKTNRLPTSLISPGMSSSWRSSNSNSSDGCYDKLNKGDIGYGGNAFGQLANGSEAGEGLLARRLKGLDVQRSSHKDGGF